MNDNPTEKVKSDLTKKIKEGTNKTKKMRKFLKENDVTVKFEQQGPGHRVLVTYINGERQE